MKKIKYFMFMVMVFCVGIGFTYAASLKVSANKTTVVVGNTVVVTVKASGASGWEYCLSYDSSVFSLSSTTSDTGGTCVRTGSTLTGYDSVTFTLKAKKSGSSTVTLKSYAMYGDDGEVVSSSVGSVTLKAKTQAEIEASYSTNADLKSLTVDGYDLIPEFNKNTLEYSLEVENDVETVTIKAGKSDSRASISGTGEKELTEGVNKFEIVVTAEKGNKKTYVVEINRKELNPIYVTVDGKDYTIVRKTEAMSAPTYYVSTEVEIQNEVVPAYKSDITGYVLVGLKDSEGNILLYRYNEVNEEYVLYKQVSTEGIILVSLEPESLIEDYELTKLVTINNIEITGYVGNSSSEFVLVYGMNASNGETGWYKYDINENTLQRYEIIDDVSLKEEVGIYFILVIVFASLSLITILLVIVLLAMNSKLRKKNDKLISMLENSRSNNKKACGKKEVAKEEKKEKLEKEEKIEQSKVEEKEQDEKEELSKREQRRLEKEKLAQQQKELREMQEDFLKTEATEIIVDDVELEDSTPVRKNRRKKK